MNIGDTYTTGPEEAAWVVNNLIKPKSVIPSHANQPSTSGGKVITGTRVDTFSKAVKASVHIPLSGRSMEFNKKGKCVSGC
jgi:L-ascorbate metabolism protein UlaG (beta-lactamase superfamily)